MNVTLLGNYSHDGHESMVRYAEMVQGLLAAEGHQVRIIRPWPFFGRLRPSGQGIGKWLGYLDKYILFPFTLRRYVRRQKAADPQGTFLIHICDQANALYTRWLQDVPHLVTCHDVMAIQIARGLVPGLTTGRTGRLLQDWILSGLKNAAYVVCDTPETRTDLLALVPELESRSRTLELPLNYPYAPMPVAQARAELSGLDATFQPEKDRFLFHVGGNQWYKNREGVILVYAQFCASYPDWLRQHPLKLVLAGKPPTEAMLRLVTEKGLAGNVIFVTAVSNQQLCAFYTLAEALVYPSLKEGFGWPLVEAQACACPVVTSNRPPMHRLAGPAGLLAHPEDPAEFAARLFQIVSETPEMAQNRKAEALRHSANFDPKIFLQHMMAIYQIALSQKNINIPKFKVDRV